MGDHGANLIFQLLEFHCMNEEIRHSDDGLWKVMAEYIVTEK